MAQIVFVRVKKILLKCRLTVLVVAGCLYAQSNEWPLSFEVPEPPDTAQAVSGFTLSNNQTLFENYLKSNNGLTWRQNTSAWRMQQTAVYNALRYFDYNTLNQFIDFSGSYERLNFLPGKGSAGLEWRPVSTINLRKTEGEFQITNDMGPFAEWKISSVPVRVRGGASGASWSTTAGATSFQNKVQDAQSNMGFYGGLSFGDYSQPIFGLPLYLNAQAFGRAIENVGLGVITGSALYMRDMGSGDSVFLFYGDSLSNGKERIWGNNQGQQNYTNTPWRIARSLRTEAALKARERYGLIPSMIYSFSDNTVSYPSEPQYLSDVKTTGQSLNFQVLSLENSRFQYKGGLKFSWGDEEWLFGKDLSLAKSIIELPSDTVSVVRNRMLDSLRTKLGDHRTYSAATDHLFWLQLFSNLRAEYKLSALRNSRTYTFSYKTLGSENRNFSDNDLITIINHVGLVTEQSAGFSTELYGEYSRYIENYLKSEYSAQNKTLSGYRIGLLVSYAPGERFRIDEHLVADAEISDYRYTEFHRDPFDPPPYARELSSVCNGTLKIAGPWSLIGRWTETYNDYGYWYGKEYRQKDSLRSDFYAIANKTIDYSLQFSVARRGTYSSVESGCLFRDIFDRNFNGRNYESVTRIIDNNLEPFAAIKITAANFSLNAKIARMINTSVKDSWRSNKNWDIHLTGQLQW